MCAVDTTPLDAYLNTHLTPATQNTEGLYILQSSRRHSVTTQVYRSQLYCIVHHTELLLWTKHNMQLSRFQLQLLVFSLLAIIITIMV